MRRGLIGHVRLDQRPAVDLAEAWRSFRRDVRPYLAAWRADRIASLRLVARCVLVHTDRPSLLSRPGHKLIAAETGLDERTVCRRIDDLHELGYLVTTELGTTKRIRAGRAFLEGRTDPHADQEERAQEYLVCVPVMVAGSVPGPTTNRCHSVVSGTMSDLQKQLTVHPSHSERSSELRTDIQPPACREPAGGYARAHARSGGARSPAMRRARRPRRQVWISADRHQVSAVWNALPAALTGLLASHEAERLLVEIGRQLDHRSVAELAARAASRWEYWRYKLAADLVREPIAVAFKVVRRGLDCADVRCEDGWQLDQDERCKACEATGKAINEERMALAGAQSVSGGRTPVALTEPDPRVDQDPSGHHSPSGAVRSGPVEPMKTCRECGVPFHRSVANPPQVCAACRE